MDKGLGLVADEPGLVVVRGDRDAFGTVFFIVWGAGFSIPIKVPFTAEATDGFWAMASALAMAAFFGGIGGPTGL